MYHKWIMGNSTLKNFIVIVQPQTTLRCEMVKSNCACYDDLQFKIYKIYVF